MLIEYKVSNFRSIYSEQSFNMMAIKSYKEKMDTNTIPYSEQISLLKSTAIYGPNASGKSTLLESLDVFRDIVLYSSTKFDINTNLPIIPFAFGLNSKEEPTSFEITFVEDNIKYILGLVLNEERILEEYLIAYPKTQPQNLYIRMYDEENNEYKYQYGSNLKGQKKIWEKATKKNSLFLSTAINLQNDESNQLLSVYNWFSKRLNSVSIHGWSDKLSKEYCNEENTKNQIINFLKLAGIDIEDIIVETEKLDNLFSPLSSKSSNNEDDKKLTEIEDSMKQMESLLHKLVSSERLEELKKITKIKFVHSNGISLSLSSQSDGTKKLFSFASHWLESLKNGKVLFIDELNDNFHPALVKLLVDMFNDNEFNKNNAQLIFTTHETSILNQDVLRRDQVWFCDRNDNLSTKVYPLSDFKPRKEFENLENSYLIGRYGALPYFNKVLYKMNIIKAL